jgi:hypothetical protein
MGNLRTALSLSILTGSALLSLPASSGPSIEHLVSGDATARGGVLVAGDHGARYELRGGSIVEMAAGTEFSFDPSIKMPLGKPGEPDTLARVVRLSRGTADITVPAKKDPTALLVRGPGKLSSVTRLGVSTFVAAEDRSTAACRNGDLLVGVGNDWKPLKVGFARTLAPENPTAIPRAFISAPAPGFDHALVFVRGSATGHAEATWQPLKDATSYDVRISRVEPAGARLVSRRATTSPSVSLDALSPGSYAVVVAAVDKSGLSGAPSESKTVRVAGVEVPDGAAVTDDGVIVLAKEQRVKLVGAEGLEVSYGTSRFFAAAPSTLGLAHDESVVARLRAPGSTEETVIRLEPRGLRARVHIDPKAAYWPGDRVDVTVDLYDARGRAVPESVEVKTTVTVNLEPVKLDWRRAGHSLNASVPPSVMPGPWVVRAEVRDGRGELLGRDFVEIAKSRAGTGVAHR